MEESGKKYIVVLMETLNKQVSTLEEILEITKQQSAIANAPTFDEEKLDETLNRKEILIGVLNTLDDGFVSVYDRVRNEIQRNKEAYKDEILVMQELIKKSTDLGVEIKVLEERNRNTLSKCFSTKQKQYGTQQNAAAVASRYHQTMHANFGGNGGMTT